MWQGLGQWHGYLPLERLLQRVWLLRNNPCEYEPVLRSRSAARQHSLTGTAGQDFCENNCQSNCGTPKDPGGGGDARDRVVGYYESWRAHLDSCGVMTPAQIPVDQLDILNFAFAYVNTDVSSIVCPVPLCRSCSSLNMSRLPQLDIVPMDNDASLDDPWEIFHEVTNVKFRNPKLQVWLSIGGWDFFNDGGQHMISPISRDALKLLTVENKSRHSANLWQHCWECRLALRVCKSSCAVHVPVRLRRCRYRLVRTCITTPCTL